MNINENASELNRSTTTLNQQYQTLETQSNLNFDAAQDAINTSQRRLRQAAGAVATREFTETNLTAQPANTTLSATEPTPVSGRLTAANGTAIANATVEVGIGEDTVTTQTDANGTYTTTYQPLIVAPNASTLTATYVPEPAAPYLSSTASTNVSVRGQPATAVTVTNATTAAGFEDPVRVTGHVNITGVESRSRAGLPVTLQIDGQQQARTETSANGSFTLQTALSEQIPAGERTLRVELASEELILASANATAPLTVSATPTTLSVSTTDNESESQNISIVGTLATEKGEPLAERSLQLRVGDTPVGTVETDASGAYQTTIDRTDIPEGAQTLTVQFTASGSNLEPSTAEQQLPVASSSPLRRPAVVGGGLILVIIGGLLALRWQDGPLWRRLRSRLGFSGAVGQPAGATTAETPVGEPAATVIADDDDASEGSSLIERAQTALDAGDPNAAVQLAYAAFRAQTGSALADTPETHWEVYDRWRTADQSDSSQVYQLTTAYEQATFAPDSVSVETARTVIEMLPSITAGSEPSGRSAAASGE